MPNETRTIVVILVVAGMLSCGCICMPIGVALTLPAVVQARRAARAVNDPQLAPVAEWAPPAPPKFEPPTFQPPSFDPPSFDPPAFTPPGMPPGAPIGAFPNPIEPIPSASAPDNPFAPPPGVSATPATPSVAPDDSLRDPTTSKPKTEVERKRIYVQATGQRIFLDRLIEQVESLEKLGIDGSPLQRAIDEAERRLEEQKQRIADRNHLTLEELDAILAEGDAAGWGPERRSSK